MPPEAAVSAIPPGSQVKRVSTRACSGRLVRLDDSVDREQEREEDRARRDQADDRIRAVRGLVALAVALPGGPPPQDAHSNREVEQEPDERQERDQEQEGTHVTLAGTPSPRGSYGTRRKSVKRVKRIIPDARAVPEGRLEGCRPAVEDRGSRAEAPERSSFRYLPSDLVTAVIALALRLFDLFAADEEAALCIPRTAATMRPTSMSGRAIEKRWLRNAGLGPYAFFFQYSSVVPV